MAAVEAWGGPQKLTSLAVRQLLAWLEGAGLASVQGEGEGARLRWVATREPPQLDGPDVVTSAPQLRAARSLAARPEGEDKSGQLR